MSGIVYLKHTKFFIFFREEGKENQVQQLWPDEPEIFCTKGITIIIIIQPTPQGPKAEK
jgi:hypothetical protein